MSWLIMDLGLNLLSAGFLAVWPWRRNSITLRLRGLTHDWAKKCTDLTVWFWGFGGGMSVACLEWTNQPWVLTTIVWLWLWLLPVLMDRNDNKRRLPNDNKCKWAEREAQSLGWPQRDLGAVEAATSSEDIMKGLMCQAEEFKHDWKTVKGTAEGCEAGWRHTCREDEQGFKSKSHPLGAASTQGGYFIVRKILPAVSVWRVAWQGLEWAPMGQAFGGHPCYTLIGSEKALNRG